MSIYYRLLLALAIVGLLSLQHLTGQTTLDMSLVQETYRKGQELFDKKEYSLAYKELDKAIGLGLEAQSREMLMTAQYLKLECMYALWHSDLEVRVLNFIKEYPDSKNVNGAFLLLGKHYFREAKYEKASMYFEKVNSTLMSDEEFNEYYFKRGYSLFVQGQYSKASPIFSLIKDCSSKYAVPATYYYAHIAYEQGMYGAALPAFTSLKEDPVFAKLVPFYILHIYHQQKQYDKVIAEGAEFVRNLQGKRAPEVNRMVAEAYYYKEQYADALPYMQRYADITPVLTRQDKYLLGYMYYKNKDYEKSSNIFEQIVISADSLAQSAYYYLADAWLQQNNKESAARAFLQASKMDFFPDIKEDAMFNYAKLIFELNTNPFNDAITALNFYKQNYPKSARIDQVNKLLVKAYQGSKDYKAAYEALLAIQQRDAEVLAALQRVTYYYGVELFQNEDFAQAVTFFDYSLAYDTYDPRLAAQAKYWKADANYRLGKYEDAKTQLNQFRTMPAARKLDEYTIAPYNLGYAYFKLGEFANAYSWFRMLVDSKIDNPFLIADAYNRMGDCNFMQHKYAEAAESYKWVMNKNSTDADYATYQCGICYGLVQQPKVKIQYMDKVIAMQPVSPYADNALFEKGRTYVMMEDYHNAVSVYMQLLGKSPQNPFYSKSLIEMGLIFSNQKDNKQALDYYKRAVAEYPGTAEARTALLGIKNIYTESGDVEAYFNYMNSLGHLGGLNLSEKDSMTYAAAESAYSGGDYGRARVALERYLNDYKSGTFVLDANFLLGDCYYRVGKLEEAIPYFEYVLRNPKSEYTEPALLGAARSSAELGDNAKAAEYYSQLMYNASNKMLLQEARLGKLRADYQLERMADVIEDATALLTLDNLGAENIREAYYKRALAYQKQGMADKAFADFKQISTDLRTKQGAEAKYRVAMYYADQNRLDEAEEEILDFSRKGTPHQYWLAKSFILLGDIYMKRNDTFQAKATYESIVDGYNETGDGIVDEVIQRINALVKTEQAKEKESNQSPYTINLQ